MALEEELVEKLIEKQYHISFAESCTGGMCSATLVNVTNASKVLWASFVTYANEAKMKFLGVKPQTILEHGVVSEAVAAEMALGAANAAGAQVGVGVTGVAGPGGGTAKKPVGMVCFGFSINGNVKTYTKYFGEIGRNQVRKSSVEFVFSTLIYLLNQ
ncbi:MAG: nicotinamide-nucleotide amidohydrolase family protein [Clostridiales bacterium]|nr:nicotinamide-nucleotide amidohydrolase family protein [Clostridiales bacterium]